MRYSTYFAAVVVAASCLATAASAQGTPPQAGGPVHVVTYLDLATGSAAQGMQQLRQYRDAARKQAANIGVDVYQEIGRAGRFAVREAWRDGAALEANGKAAHSTQLAAGLKSLQRAPADPRVHDGYSVGSGSAAAGPASVYVLTHVDVTPPQLPGLEPLLKQLAEASRKEPGAILFDVLQQASRKNHFTVAEGWQTGKAFEAHGAADAARQFRDKLGPMLGALYDQRVYRLVK
jgi:quinol monooxygenase YgiN